MKTRAYQICQRCIMDTSDPEIRFDDKGICNHCRQYERTAAHTILPLQQRTASLERLVATIKHAGRKNEYDCVIGVSGGVDSTYVAYLVKKLGLRPLAVHMDNGWNSELAVSNIEKALNKLDIDLHTHVLDWEEFRDLQKAFLRASVPDAEIPTDHAIWSVLYHTAAKYSIRYILLGANFATEAILPKSWTYGILDWRYIRGVHQQFGMRKLKSFPHLSFWQLRFIFPLLKRVKKIDILDYVPFDKQEAMKILEDELDWRPYGGKHYESIYTRFFQGHILPRKFGIDKRRAHLSTLIMSKQISRTDAIEAMKVPAYAGHMFEEDIEFVLKKLEYSETQFNRMMSLPIQSHRDYPNGIWLNRKYMQAVNKIQLGKRMQRLGLRSNFAME